VTKRESKRNHDVAVISAYKAAVEESSGRDLAAIAKRLDVRIGEIRNLVQAIDSEESRKLEELNRGLGAQISDLQRRLLDLPAEEAREGAYLLRRNQEQHIRMAMHHATIDRAQLKGVYVSKQLRDALIASGVRCAADVTPSAVNRVRGFGPVRVRALVDWASGIMTHAQQTMPRGLLTEKRDEIRKKYAAIKAAAERDLATARGLYDKSSASITTHARQQRIEAIAREAGPRAEAHIASDAVQTALNQARKGFAARVARIEEEREAELRPLREAEKIARKAVLDAEWERARLQRRIELFGDLRFAKFARIVLGFTRKQ
jgi:hypothetical protein